jgi:acyl-CoA synthetase (NDP forming)
MTNELDTTPIETARTEGRTTLTEAESKTLLTAAGIKTPPHEVVESADGAVNAAESIGYPVVVKVASPAVQHKSEWADGAGVALGLDSADAVRSAAERVLDTAATEEIEARVLVGLGGVFTEIFEETSHRLAPIDADEARTALEDLRAATLLRGYRGRPAADLDALANTVCAVGDLVVEYDEIADVDVNPVLAGSDSALALDGLITLTEVKH